MSWLLEVDDQHTIGFGIDTNGAQYIYGDAVSTIFSMGQEIPERLRKVGASWTLCTPDATDTTIDGNGCGLLDLVRGNPKSVYGMAVFHKANARHDTEDLVGFSLVVPSAQFEPIRRMFELAMLSRSPMRNIITLPFFGFRLPQATTDTPTVHEFLDGDNPLMFNEIKLTTRRLTD